MTDPSSMRVTITSLDDPRLDDYRHLKATNRTRWSGRFIAEGRLVVERLLASRFEVESVLVSERRLVAFEPFLPPGVAVYVVAQELAERLVGYNFHTGILAAGRRKPTCGLSELVPAGERPGVIVVLPNTNDPENLGAIIRIGRTLGVSGLLLGPGCGDPFSRRVLRVSMGNAFQLPIRESANLHQDLDVLRHSHGFEIAATLLDDAAIPLAAAARPRRLALLFGNEAQGLEPEWRDLADLKLTIPMEPGSDSLNVGVAAGIFLHHFLRSRD